MEKSERIKHEHHALLRVLANDMEDVKKDYTEIGKNMTRIRKSYLRIGINMLKIEKDMNRFIEISNVLEEGV